LLVEVLPLSPTGCAAPKHDTQTARRALRGKQPLLKPGRAPSGNWISPEGVTGAVNSAGRKHRGWLVALALASVGAATVVIGTVRAPQAPESDGRRPTPTDRTTPQVTKGRCGQRLSFVSERSGRKQIYSIDIQHPSSVTQVTDLPGHAFDPTWSPDGRRFAFRWFRSADSLGVFVAESDGSGVKLLVDGGVTPNWSPDGRFIGHAAPGGLFIVDVAAAIRGSDTAGRTLTESTQPQEYPDWSPDGERLLFAGYRTEGPGGGSYDIWTIDADGSNLLDLTPWPSLEYGATWSPDGKQVVFGSLRGSAVERGEDLFIIDANGDNLARLTSTGGNGAPAWSPNGRWIAFVSNRVGNPDVYLMRPDGSRLRRLTTHRAGGYSPTWIGECE
jgi:Tol biopolymer transport system component